jgi:hypothetical protein
VSRPLRHALHSLSLSARKTVFFACKLGEVFPLVARGLLTNIALCSSGLHRHFSSAETPRNACTFLSEKSPLGFRGAFFIAFRAKSFRSHGPRRLFFFRHVWSNWRGGSGVRGVVVGLK